LIEPIDTPMRLPRRVARSSPSMPESGRATTAIVWSILRWLAEPE
jgi:hypothetical protein